MRNYISLLIMIAVLILGLPALSLINKKTQKSEQPPPEGVKKYLVLNHESGKIISLSPSEYIKGVVGAEMPISYSTEALKAQAVAANTYMIRQIGLEQKSKTAELNGAYISTDSSKYQAYISKESLEKKWGANFEVNWDKLSKAVDEVINEVIVYENKPIVAVFCAISNGKTVNSSTVWGRELSYLTPVISEGDEMSPDFEQKKELTFDEVQRKIKACFSDIVLEQSKDEWFKIITTNDHGYVEKIKVGSIEMSGQKLKEMLNLRSATFIIQKSETGFIFTTKGYGHNVGMSQYSADFMARQGSKYTDILMHFYPGTKLEKIQ